MTNDREHKLRCLELAAQLILPNRDVTEVIKTADILYSSLPPGPDASKVKKNLIKGLERESRAKHTQS